MIFSKSRYRSSRLPSTLMARLRAIVLYLLYGFILSSVALCLIFRWVPPPTSMFMLYRHGEDLIYKTTFRPIEYSWVSAYAISPNAGLAVIAAEDQRFFQHSGFDLHSIQSSIDVYMDGGKLRGASTLSQQVAKNLFLIPSKSFIRKGLEVWFTVLIEVLWSKERILLVYLNIAEFGDHLFGIEAASQNYFGVPAKQLSRSQVALLASTLPNPIVLQVRRPSSYVLKRQHWILRQMQNLGATSYLKSR